MKKCLVTGGMGFIGFNAALYYARKGFSVVIWDDLSRRTAARNYEEFRKMDLPSVQFIQGDVRDAQSLNQMFRDQKGFDLVVHMAAQVAVTTSVVEPRQDFEVNALGTFNVLEAVRQHSPEAFFIFASTNKVYGGMEWVRLGKRKARYFFKHPKGGVDEEAPLDFHSPYGCSKGSADQYVRDYARIYGLKTVVFRQSCIYGPWQYGEEDQGWVAWFLIAALSGKPITVYGDGKQVRDVLYIDDLLALYDLAWKKPKKASGQVFNVGGSPSCTLSLLELLDWMRHEMKVRPKLGWSRWRPGDQKVYVSDISRVRKVLGWKPQISVQSGLGKLLSWLSLRF